MYIPLAQKIKYKNDIYMERPLPNAGYLTAQPGDLVKPFTKLGMSKLSYQKLSLGPDFVPVRGKKEGAFFYQDEKVGTSKLRKIIAPFNGFLRVEDNEYVFTQEERDYWLLSGAWGQVSSVAKGSSVLIKTQVIDLKFAVCTEHSISGELVVFPNPGEALVLEYLQNLSKNIYGKIIYVGDYLSNKSLKKAMELGVTGILAGGTDSSSYSLAKEKNMFLGLLTGFGAVNVPPKVFEILKGVSNRFVFVNGEEKLLRIPAPEAFDPHVVKDTCGNSLRNVEKGLQVLVLQKPHFGKVGVVDTVGESSIFVRFPEKEETVEVFIPNLLSLE